MILNGNTFAYGAFQIDTRPLYIECEFDATQQKYVPVQDYTLQQITEAAKTRPVFAKVDEYIVPLVYLSSSDADFELYRVSNPSDPTSSYLFISVKRTTSAWNIDMQDV